MKNILFQKISSVTVVAIISLLILVAVGCSKNTETPPSNTRDLGAIELRAGVAKSLDLGDRKECFFVASPATNDEFSVSLTVETRSFIGVVDKEQTKSARVTAHSGQKCVARLGDTDFQFTPTLTAE